MKQREPYEALAKTDKQRYEDEKASYNVSTESSSSDLCVSSEANVYDI